MEKDLIAFGEQIKSEVAALVYSEGEGSSFEDKFTEYCLNILDDDGVSEGARVLSYIHPDSKQNIDWKINGYCLKDEYTDEKNVTKYDSLDLFIVNYNSSSYDYVITKEDFTKSLNQLKRFLNAALKGHINYIDPSYTELNDLINYIKTHRDDFRRINLFILINGVSNQKVEKITLKDFDEISFHLHIWDLSRLFKLSESNGSREPIEIDFIKDEYLPENETGIQCLKVSDFTEIYECYLAIVPGYVLAKIYDDRGGKVLESNVRAFLGETKFNKPIKTTISGKPHMFLPYNNGITATGERVETVSKEGQLYITKIVDFQIVNGGQTTAALYHYKKTIKRSNYEGVYVQMKLTVIKDEAQKNIEVPLIAKFANSQNKVEEADFSSNNPFYTTLEKLSRKNYVINPDNPNQSTIWYFERVKGQYNEAIKKKKNDELVKFKIQNPSNQKLLKTDVAKIINLWQLEPYIVSKGKSKNFVHFTKKTKVLIDKEKLPGENFYKTLVANAILYNTLDKLFGKKGKNPIGDTNLKSYTVAYTLSYLHYCTDNRIDLWKIYGDQKIGSELSEILKNLQKYIYDQYIAKTDGKFISELLKKEDAWTELKKLKSPMDSRINNYLISKEEALKREDEEENSGNNFEETLFLISEIREIGLKYWDGLIKYITINSHIDFDSNSLNDLLKKLIESRNLTAKDVLQGKKGLGFASLNPNLITEIRNLSQLSEMKIVNLKMIYDRLKLIAKSDWDKIIALGEQKNIFDYGELSNLKSIRNSLTKKEKVSEQSIEKSFESMKKIKKFGIDIFSEMGGENGTKQKKETEINIQKPVIINDNLLQQMLLWDDAEKILSKGEREYITNYAYGMAVLTSYHKTIMERHFEKLARLGFKPE